MRVVRRRGMAPTAAVGRGTALDQVAPSDQDHHHDGRDQERVHRAEAGRSEPAQHAEQHHADHHGDPGEDHETTPP